MRIEFGEYRIRDWVNGDAQSLVRYANNRNVARWLWDRFPHPYIMADARAFLAGVVALNPQTTFAIATGDEAIGGVGLEFGSDIHRFTAELGYFGWASRSGAGGS